MKTEVDIKYKVVLEYEELLCLESLLENLKTNEPASDFDEETFEQLSTMCHRGIKEIENAAKGLNRGWLNER